ncbi:iron-containing alcohol dehydrogenase [Microbacterium album]|uniref:Alcohol dehydrogenase n=1 Tax=Microbacterium album TaxID=2053191 RepID=A0A917IER1_9MICO|nr:iron-containing alcohol dehydrogenase [Microbacterium album]GGH42452.1 alcohol dehydrogenase [Microbacterium album]
MSAEFGVLRLPEEIRFGWGARASVPGIVRALGVRALVVTDAVLAGTPHFRDLMAEIEGAGVGVTVQTDVPAELPMTAIVRLAEAARNLAPDVVVGYGGGSALDAAKLVALLLTHGGTLPDYYGENRVPGPVLPLVAIPTTAGTGSEVTPVAVISDPDRELKVGVSSPRLIPRVAVVDPELTVGAPRGVTAHAGIDAFVHAVESFTARDLVPAQTAPLPVFVGRNALTAPLSLEAAALIHEALPRVIDDPADVAARTAMARGSLLAGMAFGAAGTHLSHAIQYPVGALTHTPHGLGTGTLLPFVMQACAAAVPDRLARLGEALGLPPHGTVAARAQSAVDAIAALCARIGLPPSLAELGISETELDRIVELTLMSARLVTISPLPQDAEAVARIVRAAHVGDRSLLA